MEKQVYKCGGKTFLLGEYAALVGGPTLLMSTSPEFELHVSKTEFSGSQNFVNLFHPKSPAGKLIASFPKAFDDFYAQFCDPYIIKKIGGFGASTAQYLLCLRHMLWTQGKSLAAADMDQYVSQYRELSATEAGVRPSGADLVSQICGSMVYYSRNEDYFADCSELFSGFDIHLFFTGHKVKTHEHLASINEESFLGLADRLRLLKASILRKDIAGFFMIADAFVQDLEERNLIADASRSTVSSLRSREDVAFVKACGAMGADVIAVVTTNAQFNVKEIEEAHALTWVSSNKNLTSYNFNSQTQPVEIMP